MAKMGYNFGERQKLSSRGFPAAGACLLMDKQKQAMLAVLIATS